MAFKKSRKLEGIEISIIRQMNNKANPDTINLGIGQLPYQPPLLLRLAGAQAFLGGKTRYTPTKGDLNLRDLIAREHQLITRKKTSSEDVIVTVGAEEALDIVCRASLDEGDEVLIPEIFFSVYDTLPRMNRAFPITYKLTLDFGIDIEDLESKITDRTKLVFINTPSNPTGRVLTRRELIRLAEVLEGHPDVYIISDEIYSHLYFEEQPASMSEFSDRVITINGISKRASATGLRIGWTIAPEEVTKELVKVHQYGVTSAASTSQLAAIPVLKGECFEDEEKYRALLRKNRDLTIQRLSEIQDVRLIQPKGAFYCFPDISHYGNSQEVADRILKEENVLTIPGVAFGQKGDSYIRISYAIDTEQLQEGLGRISRVLK